MSREAHHFRAKGLGQAEVRLQPISVHVAQRRHVATLNIDSHPGSVERSSHSGDARTSLADPGDGPTHTMRRSGPSESFWLPGTLIARLHSWHTRNDIPPVP